MNQDNNKEQNNGIPNIFRSPIDNPSNNLETGTENSVSTPEIHPNLVEEIPVFDIPNFNGTPQDKEPIGMSNTTSSETVSYRPTEASTNQANIFGGSISNQPIQQQPSMNEVPSMPASPLTVESISSSSVMSNEQPAMVQNNREAEVPVTNAQSSVIPDIESGNMVNHSSVPKEEGIEELNPWVAAVEAEKEEQVVMTSEPKEPVPTKPMVPHTVEDLIAAEAPVVSEPEKSKKKIPWKFFAIIGGIIVAIILIVIAIAIFNKAGNKTLSCSLADTNGGIEYRSTNNFVFKGKNMSTLGTKVEYTAVDDANHTDEMTTMKSVIQFMDEQLKGFSGVKTAIKASDKSISYDITLEHDKVKSEEWSQEDDMFVEVTALEYFDKDYNTIKKEMTELGYTCK